MDIVKEGFSRLGDCNGDSVRELEAGGKACRWEAVMRRCDREGGSDGYEDAWGKGERKGAKT